MFKFDRMIAVACFVTAFVSTQAAAAVLPLTGELTDPNLAATYGLGAAVSNGEVPVFAGGNNGPTSYNLNQPNGWPASASAEVDLYPRTISVSASSGTATVFGNTLNYGAGGYASLSYNFEFVPMAAPIQSNPMVTFLGDYYQPTNSHVSVTVGGPDAANLYYFMPGTPSHGEYSSDPFELQANTVYSVDLKVDLSALPGLGLETAFIDPTIEVSDPSDWKLLLSPGIGNDFAGAVPEPSTWAMMIFGFFCLGFIADRRKGRTASTVT